jgi:hypothetical protein
MIAKTTTLVVGVSSGQWEEDSWRCRTRMGMQAGGGSGSSGFCMDMGATCVSFALLMPTIVDAMNIRNSIILMMELYLLCPFVSVFAASCQPCS